MDIDGKNMKIEAINDIMSIGDISPDGEFVVYHSVIKGDGQIFVRNMKDNSNTKIYTERLDRDGNEDVGIIGWPLKDKIILGGALWGKYVAGKGREIKKYFMLLNPQNTSTEIVYSGELPEIEGVAISSAGEIMLFGNACILKKTEDGQWQKVREFVSTLLL